MPCTTFNNIKSPADHACTACASPIIIRKMAKNRYHPNTLRSSNPLSFMRMASFNLDQGSVGLLESDPITRHVFVLQVLLANPYLSLLNMESQAGGQHLVDNKSLFKSRSSLSNQIAWRLENSSFCKHPQIGEFKFLQTPTKKVHIVLNCFCASWFKQLKLIQLHILAPLPWPSATPKASKRSGTRAASMACSKPFCAAWKLKWIDRTGGWSGAEWI